MGPKLAGLSSPAFMKKLRFRLCPRITRTSGTHEGLSPPPSEVAVLSKAVRADSYFCPLEGDPHRHVQGPPLHPHTGGLSGATRSSLCGHYILITSGSFAAVNGFSFMLDDFCVNAEQRSLKRTIKGKDFLPGSRPTPPGGAGSGPAVAVEPGWLLVGSSLPVLAPCHGHGASGVGVH